MNFNFNVRAYHILLKILDKINIKEVFAEYEAIYSKMNTKKDEKIDSDVIFKMIDVANVALKALILSEKETIDLMSIVSNRTVDEIANMNAIEYVKLRKEFIQSIDWSELVGEHLAMIPIMDDQQEEQQDNKN